MEPRGEAVGRVREYWQSWQARRGGPDSVSVVTIGRDRFIQAPAWVRPRLGADAVVDLESLVTALGDDVQRVVGEARLAYADEETLRLVATDDVTEVRDDARIAALEAGSDRGEWLEASVDEPCLRRFGITRDGSLLSVATLQVWDGAIGQIGVFTAGPARGRGLAAAVTSAAIKHALARGCVPQWRSRIGNDESTRVGDKLGFVAVGRQMTVRVTAPS